MNYPQDVPRAPHHRYIDVTDNYVSYNGRRCYEFGYNPDLDELLRYNEEAKQAACPHENVQVIQGDDRTWSLCRDCGKPHVPYPKGHITRSYP